MSHFETPGQEQGESARKDVMSWSWNRQGELVNSKAAKRLPSWSFFLAKK